MKGFGDNHKYKKISKKTVYPPVEEVIDYAINLQLKGDYEEAIKCYKYCIDKGINDSRVFCNYGLILINLGDLENAQLMMEKSIEISPNDTLSLNNLSGILQELGKYSEAESILNKSLEIDQKNSITYSNLGTVFLYQGKLDKAELILKKSLSINPKEGNSYLSLGVVMRLLGKTEEAVKYTNKAIDIQPNNDSAYCNIGDLFRISREYKKAITSFEKALSLNNNNASAKFGLLICQGLICDWSNYNLKNNWIKNLGIIGKPLNPYPFLLYDDNPIIHFKRSKKYANKIFNTHNKYKFEKVKFHKNKEGKIRIGYFSEDFRDHPVTHMITSLLEDHDKAIFEIFLYSFTRKEDTYTNKLKNLECVFRDIKDLDESETIKLVLSDNLNIAIDLMGYTGNNRYFIFRNRIAPNQINYLGFPGTMGSYYYDYIVGDKLTIPKKEEKFYTEKVLRLNHFFPPNPCLRDLSPEDNFTKDDFKIPKNAFIFTCFNDNKKITPKEFDIWMNLLSEIKDGILWLSKSNNLSVINLKKAAEKRNIDPERIIFAERLNKKGQHLARYKVSDLALDTFNYNGHTTTSDALCMGLPVLTKIGKSFASRIAASILNSFDLNDLIATTEEEYEEKALYLAKNREEILKLKSQLKNINDENLLKSEIYAREIENLYKKIIK
tara:strand:- start:283 stop:2280 length:1998 start_codon:yes stop_codon:yes gene_type:complete